MEAQSPAQSSYSEKKALAARRVEGRRRSRLLPGLIALGLLVVIIASGLAWDAVRSGPVWHQIQRLAGNVEAPHPSGRWYQFGHRLGRTQASTSVSLGLPVIADPADLAYALKELGVPQPAPQTYNFCLQGFRDGMAGRAARYTPQKNTVGDDFPEALSGL